MLREREENDFPGDNVLRFLLVIIFIMFFVMTSAQYCIYKHQDRLQAERFNKMEQRLAAAERK